MGPQKFGLTLFMESCKHCFDMEHQSTITLLHPLPGRVVLRRTEPAAAPSPYVIPDQAKEKPVEAVVVAIPRLPYYEYGVLIPCPVNEGDLCLVGKYAGDHKFRGEDVTIVRWDEILAVISEPGEEKESTSLPSAADLDLAADEQSAAAQTTNLRAVPRI